MLPNIVLIGFMGCGKSSIGRRLVGMTGLRFVDTDDLVSSRAGRSISSIFKEYGEAHFRDLESEALRGLAGTAGIILATGGGAVLREENRACMHSLGTVVWLDAAPDVLFERVSRNRKRPLLQTENPRETFDRLLEARRPIYEAASDLRIDSTGLSHDDAARVLLEEVVRLRDASQAGGFGS